MLAESEKKHRNIVIAITKSKITFMSLAMLFVLSIVSC